MLNFDERIKIALDAMRPDQRASFNKVTRNEETFMSHAYESIKIKNKDNMYKLQIGDDMVLFYLKDNDNITLLDIFRLPASTKE